jgi:hypothetical protein
LAVPYTHTVFTIPHQLNKIAKQYPKQIYNLLLRSAWETVKQLSADPTNVGALPGMISVLHTFGSDIDDRFRLFGPDEDPVGLQGKKPHQWEGMIICMHIV